MCNLCSDDPQVREAERQRLLKTANAMRSVANHLHRIAFGLERPHSRSEQEYVRPQAHDALQYLTQEWL